MFLSQSMPDVSLGDAGIYALLGYSVVFFGLILLMAVLIIMGKCFTAAEKRKATAPAPVIVEDTQEPVSEAPGSAGQLKLYNVEPKTAAMLMAIVADKLGKPINELRFISIKEVTE